MALPILLKIPSIFEALLYITIFVFKSLEKPHLVRVLVRDLYSKHISKRHDIVSSRPRKEDESVLNEV